MDIAIPELGDVGQVRLVRWLADEGQHIHEGQELVEVEADKAVFVIEAPGSGVLRAVSGAPGASARPGQVIARLEAT